MAIVANTFTTYSAVGIREELSNVIYNISPEETPFISNIGKEKTGNTFFEWQTDALAAASTSNAVVEGDDISSFTAVTPTDRLGNYCQISRKDVIISGTEEIANKAGRKSEMSYQLAKKGAELKRDMEAILLYNQAANAGNSSTARKTAGLPAFLRTNTNYYTTDGGDPTVSSGVVNAARTDGTQRSFTEVILKDVVAQCWTEGANPKLLMVGPVNKQRASGFTGIAETRVQAKSSPTTIIGAADVYVSDFGNLSIVPNRFQREREAFVIDPEYAALVQYRPIQQEALAKTGDAEKRMLIVEYGLKVKTEKAHGIAADLTTT
jgi:hypothetical protein